jgi:hypothetical protein
MSFGNGPRIVTSGLRLFLDAADRNSYPGSGTTWTDLNGGFNTGTLINGPTFDSANGGSIVFDGVNDYVSCDDIPVTYLTISVWVYKTSSTANQGICGRNSTRYAIAQINNTLQTLIRVPPTNTTYSDTGYVIPLNEWTNITYTYNDTQLSNAQTTYVNGTSIFTATASGSMSTARIRDGAFLVGYNNDSNLLSYWGGRIAQVQVYSRGLTQSEVLQNYNAQKSRFGL